MTAYICTPPNDIFDFYSTIFPVFFEKILDKLVPVCYNNYVRSTSYDMCMYAADRYEVDKWSGCRYSADRYADYKWSGCKFVPCFPE